MKRKKRKCADPQKGGDLNEGSSELSRHSLGVGGVADERLGLIEGRIVRWIARKLGVETFGYRCGRFLAAERAGVRRGIALDCDGCIGLRRVVSESQSAEAAA